MKKVEEKELLLLVEELKKCTKTLENIAVSLLGSREEKKAAKKISFEELRAFLADKSRLGFTSDIKAIINSFGANRLSEVKESDYDELLKKAKELKNE